MQLKASSKQVPTAEQNQILRELDQKQQQITNMKHLLFEVLVEKAGKRQEEDEMEYYLRKVEEARHLLSATP